MVDLGWVHWTLLAGRAAFWNERRWLVVADVHFGKAATFRARGVPVPHGTTSENLARLSDLIELLAPTALVFLGDLFPRVKRTRRQRSLLYTNGASVMPRSN